MAKLLGKICVGCLSVLAVLGVTACSNDKVDRNLQFNDKMSSALRETYNIDEFQLISADVAKTAFKFGVKFNGIGKTQEGDMSYTSVGYEVPSENFANLTKRSNTNSVYDVFDYIVENYTIENCSITPIKDIVQVSNTFAKNTPSPISSYKVANALISNISPATIDEENMEVTFTTKTLLRISKVELDISMGLGFGFTGGGSMGLSVGLTGDRQDGVFTTQDSYTISVTQEQMDQIKQDSSAIYTIASDAINSRTEIIKCERLNSCEVTYDNANNLGLLSTKDIVDEMSK